MSHRHGITKTQLRHGVAILVVMTLALAVRWPSLSDGYTSDEVSLVLPWSFLNILLDGESAVNPPWFPAIFNALFDTHNVVRWGRRWSMAMSGCTVVLLWHACQQFGGQRLWPAVVPCVLFACHPWAIDHGAVFRVYSTATAAGALYLWSLGRVLNQPSRRWIYLLGASALLLPQLHYYWLPVLAGSTALLYSSGYRQAAFAQVPGLLGTVPWLGFMWVYPAHQNPAGMMGAWEAVTMITTTGSHFGVFWTAPLTVIGLLLFPWLSVPTRFAYAGVLGFVSLTGFVSIFQMVRPPVSLFALLWLCVFLAGLLGQLYTKNRRQYLPAILSIALITGYGTTFNEAPLSSTSRVHPPNSVLQFARSLPALLGETHGTQRTVIVHPNYYLPVLHLYQTSLPISVAHQPCSKVRHCYTLDDVRYDSDLGKINPESDVLLFDAGWVSMTPPSHCESQVKTTTYAVWWCPRSPKE